MKTAIDEIIDVIEFNHNQGIEVLENVVYDKIIDSKTIFKQQIIKAYDDAFNYVVDGGFVAKTGEQYFEEMYNDKK